MTGTLFLWRILILNNMARKEGWGKGPTKSLEKLFDEIRDGETTLLWEDGRVPIRVLSLCQIKIIRRGLVLVEVNQKFRGRDQFRSRMMMPCEKMVGAETPVSAALRGAEEELGVVIKNPSLISTRVVEEPAKSFPGLMCAYTKHIVVADDDVSFPDEDFRRYDTSKTIEYNIFGWRHPDEVLDS